MPNETANVELGTKALASWRQGEPATVKGSMERFLRTIQAENSGLVCREAVGLNGEIASLVASPYPNGIRYKGLTVPPREFLAVGKEPGAVRRLKPEEAMLWTPKSEAGATGEAASRAGGKGFISIIGDMSSGESGQSLVQRMNALSKLFPNAKFEIKGDHDCRLQLSPDGKGLDAVNVTGVYMGDKAAQFHKEAAKRYSDVSVSFVNPFKGPDVPGAYEKLAARVTFKDGDETPVLTVERTATKPGDLRHPMTDEQVVQAMQNLYGRELKLADPDAVQAAATKLETLTTDLQEGTPPLVVKDLAREVWQPKTWDELTTDRENTEWVQWKGRWGRRTGGRRLLRDTRCEGEISPGWYFH